MTVANANANAVLVQRWLHEGWNQGSPDVVDQLISESWIGHDPARPGLSSRDELKQNIRSIRAAFPDLHFTIEDVLVDGNRVALRWSSLGTHQAEFLGRHPTGHKVASGGIDIYRIEDGRIAETWSYWDVIGVLRQMEA